MCPRKEGRIGQAVAHLGGAHVPCGLGDCCWQVLLIGDKSYDQGHVVKVLCKVIPGLGAMKAVAAYEEAQSRGRSIVFITDEVGDQP